MSTVNAQATVRRLKRGGTETITMVADTGDIIQDIIGYNESGKAIIAPDFTFTANQPTIFPVITVSTSNNIILPTDANWYYNSAAISFDNNGNSTGALAGKFKKVTRTSDNMPGLKIIGNLASKDNIDNDTIGFNGAIDAGGFSRRIAKDYTIQIQERMGDVRVGTISYPDGKNGVIQSQTDKVLLKANLREGNSVIEESTYRVKWKKMDGINWEILKDNAGKEVAGYTVTITAEMVNSFQLIMCEFYDLQNTLITTDTAPVQDASDPYVITPNPSPTDEAIIQEDDTVVYTPFVVTRSNQQTALPGWKFSYSLTSPTGNVIRTTSGTSVTVTVADCDSAGGGNVDVNITAQNG